MFNHMHSDEYMEKGWRELRLNVNTYLLHLYVNKQFYDQSMCKNIFRRDAEGIHP